MSGWFPRRSPAEIGGDWDTSASKATCCCGFCWWKRRKSQFLVRVVVADFQLLPVPSRALVSSVRDARDVSAPWALDSGPCILCGLYVAVTFRPPLGSTFLAARTRFW